MGTELRTCLVLFTLFLDQLGFNFMLGSYASCYTLGYGWLMMIQMLYLFYPMFMMLNVVNQEIYDLIGTWRTTQENSATTILYGSSLG